MKFGGLKDIGGTAALGLLIACTASLPEVLAGEPDVVVTIKPIHALVSQVMAGVGKPVLIVDGNASPHTFTLKPSSASAIAKAAVFIRVSEHLEAFTDKLVAGLPKNVSLVTLADERLGIKLLDRRQTGTFEPHEHEEGHEEGHEEAAHEAPEDAPGEAKDMHIWLDPGNAEAIVKVVADVLSERWPEKKDTFQANAQKARARIQAMTADIAKELKGARGQSFVVFHDAYRYFENHFGLSVVGSITISPDQQPSAKRLTQVRAKIRALNARCVFAEPTFKPKLLAAVTEGTGAHTGELDPAGQTLEPGPELYDQLMRNLAHNLVTCLKTPASP